MVSAQDAKHLATIALPAVRSWRLAGDQPQMSMKTHVHAEPAMTPACLHLIHCGLPGLYTWAAAMLHSKHQLHPEGPVPVPKTHNLSMSHVA